MKYIIAAALALCIMTTEARSQSLTNQMVLTQCATDTSMCNGVFVGYQMASMTIGAQVSLHEEILTLSPKEPTPSIQKLNNTIRRGQLNVNGVEDLNVDVESYHTGLKAAYRQVNGCAQFLPFNEIKKIWVRYLQKNSNVLNEQFVLTLSTAIKEAYPCNDY